MLDEGGRVSPPHSLPLSLGEVAENMDQFRCRKDILIAHRTVPCDMWCWRTNIPIAFYGDLMSALATGIVPGTGMQYDGEKWNYIGEIR